MKKRLAIIIPAFKARFFHEAIDSVANQTCTDFTLYVGDDASSDNLKEIIDQYSYKINIVYHRFDHNIGSDSLADQWNRSVNLSFDEEYVWLFSDDDIMPERAVESFLNTLDKKPEYDLYRFNICLIDEEGRLINSGSTHPEVESAENFILKRLRGERLSSACEYIFSKRAFNKANGFEKFPLAWGSDDAMWYKIGKEKGIYTIPGQLVCWRLSGINITSVSHNNQTKFQASLQYLKWLKSQNVSAAIQSLIPAGLIQQTVYLKVNIIMFTRRLPDILKLVGIKNTFYVSTFLIKRQLKLLLTNGSLKLICCGVLGFLGL